MKSSYVVSNTALEDLDSIDRYVFSYGGISLVEAVGLQFESAFEALALNPYLHPIYNFEPPIPARHEYRSVNVYNYKVFYWLDEQNGLVVISRVCHKAADFTRRGL